MHLTFVIHGNLWRINRLKKSIVAVFEPAYNLSFEITSAISGAKPLVKSAIIKGADFVIIVGGDGSLNEAVNGYMAVSKRQREQSVLGLLPMGSGNDFAKTLQVSKDLNELYLAIKSKSIRKIDVCQMQYQKISGAKGSRYFINIADIGLGGLAIQKVRSGSKIWGATLSYAKAIISSFIEYKKQYIELKSPELDWKGQILSLCMANGKYFGSGMCIAPDAKLNDGLIQLTILADISLWDYFRYILRLRKGEKIRNKEVRYTAVSKLSIKSNGEPCPIDMDGEFVGFTPLEVGIFQNEVRMIG